MNSMTKANDFDAVLVSIMGERVYLGGHKSCVLENIVDIKVTWNAYIPIYGYPKASAA